MESLRGIDIASASPSAVSLNNLTTKLPSPLGKFILAQRARRQRSLPKPSSASRSRITAGAFGMRGERAIDRARPLELPPRNFRYTAFSTRAAEFTLCIGHKEGESFVADVVRGTRAPFGSR